ncbi:MAG: hypothetical protein ACE15E_08560 [Acidobacteriota bacterium]
MKHFFRLWLILASAYLVITLAICWIVSGSVVYPAETVAHILIVPVLQAVILAVLFRRRQNPQSS